MNCLPVIWSVVIASSLILALMYGTLWVLDRKQHASLVFACLALALVGSVITEMGSMRADSVEAWSEWIRWSQVPIFFRVAATVIFIRLYFGVGRDWLMWSIIGLRLFILVAGFVVDPNFNFERIDSIRHVTFLGEQVTVVGKAVPASWQWVASVASTAVSVYVVDAAITLWRTGSSDARRKSLLIGGATLLSSAYGTLLSQLMILFGVHGPMLLSPAYLVMLAAMTLELSRDTLRASRLARELRDSEARLDLAASAAGLGLWAWDPHRKQLWATGPARYMFGIRGEGQVDIATILARIHHDDFANVQRMWLEGARSGNEVDVQFRVTTAEGAVHWITARGRAELDERGDLSSIQGVLRDVTDQQRAREEIEELRRELAHVGRVSVLGTLSSSLVHELSQPLGAIMLNVEAGELLLKRPNPDLDEIRQILADVRRDDIRAAEVIDSLRRLLKRRQMDFLAISVDSLMHDVAALLNSDAISRHVVLECRADVGLPPVRGDRVHLSQVLINMIMNGMDAVADLPPALRQVRVLARALPSGEVEVAVSDSGTGVPEAIMSRIFEPFFTTKVAGMGMGLSVSRTIVDAHGGKLWAENHGAGGATFRMTLPAVA